MQQAQLQFERRLRRTVTLPVVLALLLSGVLIAQLQYLVETNHWVEHADQVIGRANGILRLLVDMETGLRGFLLTGSDEFLEPYEAASRSIDRELQELDDLVVEPAQLERLVTFREKQRQWTAYAQELLRLPPDNNVAQSYETQLRGKALMDSIRLEMANFADAEIQLRDERTQRARRAIRLARIGTTVVMLLLGTALGLYARQQLVRVSQAFREALQRRELAEQDLLRFNQELEVRIQARTRELSDANTELEAFSYSVSHDLRAPLRAIDGFSQVLEEDHSAQVGEEGMDALRRIRAASQRMALLIDDLLKLSRATRGELKRTSVDITAMALSVEAELRARTPDRKVEVRVAPGMTAEADPHYLRIALANLLDNAWKFTRGTPEPRIEVSAETVDGERVYKVQDNGAGFDMAYAKKLFTPFQRLHRSADFEGTGIGLATVQRIVHRHGGRIWAHAEVGRGATFCFTLGESG